MDWAKMEKSHLSKSIEMLDAIGNNPNLENQRSHFVILNENFVPPCQKIQWRYRKIIHKKVPDGQ